MARKIGQKMARLPGVVIDGKPETHTHEQNRSWMKETQDLLEKGALAAATADSMAVAGAITGASAAISGALTAGSAAIAGNETIGGTLGVTGTSALGVVSEGATTAASMHVTGNETVDGTLNAGATTPSSLHVTGTSALDGAATLASTLTGTPGAVQTLVAATAIVANALTARITAASPITSTAAPTIADGAAGQILVVVNTGANAITLQDQATLAASNLRLITGTLVLAQYDAILLEFDATVGDWVQIGPVRTVGAISASSLTTAEADVHHGQRVLQIAAPFAILGSGVGAYAGVSTAAISGDWAAAASIPFVDFAIPLCVGDRIISVSMYGRTGSNSAWSFQLFKKPMNGTSGGTQIGSTQTSGNVTGVDATLTIGSLTETLVAGTSYIAKFLANNASTNSNNIVFGIEVTYDRP